MDKQEEKIQKALGTLSTHAIIVNFTIPTSLYGILRIEARNKKEALIEVKKLLDTPEGRDLLKGAAWDQIQGDKYSAGKYLMEDLTEIDIKHLVIDRIEYADYEG